MTSLLGSIEDIRGQEKPTTMSSLAPRERGNSQLAKMPTECVSLMRDTISSNQFNTLFQPSDEVWVNRGSLSEKPGSDWLRDLSTYIRTQIYP